MSIAYVRLYISAYCCSVIERLVKIIMQAGWDVSTIAAIASAAATVMIAIFAFWDKIWGKLYPPKIKTQVKATPPFITATAMVQRSKPFLNTSSEYGDYVKTIASSCFYYHVGLQNLRRTRADNCSVELSEVWTQKAEGFQRHDNFVPGPLKWALIEDTPRVNLYKKQIKFIDIGCIIKEKWTEFGFEIKNGFKIGFHGPGGIGLVNELEPRNDQDEITGVHRLMLTVFGDNFKPISEWFELRWTGKWASEVDKITKEFSLVKCSPPPERH